MTSPSNASPSVQLRLHGYPCVHVDGQARPLKLKRALALLAYLSEQAHPVGRDALAALLWPDAAAGLGRGRLRRLVHEMHALLGVGLIDGHADALWLNADIRSDVAATRAAIARAAVADIATLARTQAAELLAGFSLDSEAFDDWLAASRGALRAALTRALERSVARALEAADADALQTSAQALLRADACSEAGHVARVRAAALRGDLAALEGAYFEAAQVWRDELGLKPSPRIEAAYAAGQAAARATNQALLRAVEDLLARHARAAGVAAIAA